jgi:N-acetylmuramoyl-L-alanine amidase
MKLNIKLFAILFLGTVWFASCESDEALAQYVNPNQSDTSGNNVAVDLFVSVEIDNVPFSYFNGVKNYSNWTISAEEGFCPTDINKFIQSHTTAYIVPNKLEESIYIDIKGCVRSDSLKDINKIDSVLIVGTYPYYPKTTIDDRYAVVRYIDMDSILWSTAFGGNTSSFARFELSAIEDNGYDIFSKKIAYGKFEGYLYNGMGDSIKLKKGQFKGRIVQN